MITSFENVKAGVKPFGLNKLTGFAIAAPLLAIGLWWFS
jgi:hypothetical protein